MRPWQNTTPRTDGIPSWLIEEPYAGYHERRQKYLSSHALADFRDRGPAYFHARRMGLVRDQGSPAYLIGRATHARILEGAEVYAEQYHVGDGPINARTGKPYGQESQAYLEWGAEIGKPVISTDVHATIELMAAGVAAHPGASALLEHGVAERTVRATIAGEPCQGRLDWYDLSSLCIVDLKTCQQLDWFESDARRYKYIYQMAFYRDLVELVSGQVLPVYMIAVEKQAPYRCGLWYMDPTVLSAASEVNRGCIAKIIECRMSGHWPTGYEATRTYMSL